MWESRRWSPPNGPEMFRLVRSWLKPEGGKAAEAACRRAVGGAPTGPTRAGLMEPKPVEPGCRAYFSTFMSHTRCPGVPPLTEFSGC